MRVKSSACFYCCTKEGICSNDGGFSCFLKMMLGGEHVQLLDENDRVSKGGVSEWRRIIA